MMFTYLSAFLIRSDSLVLSSSRVLTLIHYVAFLDTEPKEQKPEREELYGAGKKVFTLYCYVSTIAVASFIAPLYCATVVR